MPPLSSHPAEAARPEPDGAHGVPPGQGGHHRWENHRVLTEADGYRLSAAVLIHSHTHLRARTLALVAMGDDARTNMGSAADECILLLSGPSITTVMNEFGVPADEIKAIYCDEHSCVHARAALRFELWSLYGIIFDQQPDAGPPPFAINRRGAPVVRRLPPGFFQHPAAEPATAFFASANGLVTEPAADA